VPLFDAWHGACHVAQYRNRVLPYRDRCGHEAVRPVPYHTRLDLSTPCFRMALLNTCRRWPRQNRLMPDDLRSPIKHHLVLHRIDPEQGIAQFYSL
jgi:hypothetical protein